MPTLAFNYDVDNVSINNNTGIQQQHQQQQSPFNSMMMNKSIFDDNKFTTTMQMLKQDNNFDNNVINNIIDLFLQYDSFFTQLTDLLKISPGMVSISGRRDYDYPNLEEYGNSLKTLSQFVGLKTIPLPKLLIEQFDKMIQRCEMGIFSAIGRAWLVIDTNVYLWKYDTGTDIAYYDTLSRLIIKVDLVKPRQGVFKSHIKYILLLVTYTEIILLGITFNNLDDNSCNDNDNNNNDDMGDLLVMPEPLFTISTDNVEVKIIQSTDDGRIFYGGNDGSLNEIYYQSNNNWFNSNYCYKINHSTSRLSFLIPKILKTNYQKEIPLKQIEIDRTRNILYTLNDDGDIDVYDLGVDGKSIQHIIKKLSTTITREATVAASTIVDEINFKSIVSINIVDETESIYINLIAITKTGVRLYFTTTSLSSPEARPFSLTLLHIRLPPGFSSTTSLNIHQYRSISIQKTYYKKGNFLFISSPSSSNTSYQNDNKDTLWTLSSDSFAFCNELRELYTIIPIKTRIWSMTEELNIIDHKPYQCLYFKNKQFALEPPSIVTQHLELPRKFIFLTTQGVIIGYKPRLLDQLKQLLIENNGYDNDTVKSFFHLHNSTYQSNACVFALILACDSQPIVGDEKLIEWATAAFFYYGSDTNYHQQQQYQFQHQHQTSTPFISNPMNFIDRNLPSPVMSGSPNDSPQMESTLQQTPNTPLSSYGRIQQQNLHQQQQQLQQQQYPLQNYSSKCRALFIYFSRIIRPIWNLKVITIQQQQQQQQQSSTTQQNELKELFISNISIDEIKIYLLRLTSLYNFLKINMKFSNNPTTTTMMMKNKSIDLEINKSSTSFINDQQQLELNLIYNLYKLIEQCLEVLNLWKLLIIHQFHIIVMNITQEKRKQLSTMNFKELIIYGNQDDITTSLANALVQRFIEDHSTTDIINRRLQDVCPSIYKNENALNAKVHEMVIKSKTIKNENDRQILLDNSLKLCKKIGSKINLYEICELFESIQWYEAIVDICLTTAKKRDPQSLSLHYYYKNRDKFIFNNYSVLNQSINNQDNNDNQQDLNDLQLKSIYESRIECYHLLLDIYGRLLQKCQQQSTMKNNDNDNNLLINNCKKYSQIILSLATKSTDELFHYILYQWLYENNYIDKLLEIKSTYLERYLKEKTSNGFNNDSIAFMDFLWLYYERNGHFNAAAEILSKLAEQNSEEIILTKRIEYLSRAIVCMKSLDTRSIITTKQLSPQTQTPSTIQYGSTGEFLHILEEKIDVARIQLFILNTLEKLKPYNYEQAIKRLNESLLNVTILYQDFAEQYQLNECKLKILHCAGHEDISLIENIWKNILDNEINYICSQSVDTRTRQTLLRNKIKDLAKQYIHTEKFFPLELIITILESSNRLISSSNFNINNKYWLVELLLIELKISLIDLFEIYHKIYKSIVNFKSTSNDGSQTIINYDNVLSSMDSIDLLEILIYLINHLDKCNMNFMDRQYFATKALDLISGYINDLLLFSSSNNETKLMRIRSELNRIKLYLKKK